MAAIREDWSAVEELDAHFNADRRASIEERLSPARTAEKNALANLRLKSGLAVLCIGAAIGLACLGASYVIQPNIIEKPIVTEKLVYVDKPIVTEKVVTVEKPFIIEKLVRIPAKSPETAVAKPISKPQTEEQFRNQPDFKNAQYSGIIESYIGGDIVFSGGKKFNHIKGSNRLDKPWLVGTYAYCIISNPELQCYMCYSWINGRQELI